MEEKVKRKNEIWRESEYGGTNGCVLIFWHSYCKTFVYSHPERQVVVGPPSPLLDLEVSKVYLMIRFDPTGPTDRVVERW